MIFRIFYKFVKGVIAIVVLLCILFAVLQTKWAKMQIKEKIVSYLKEAGITAGIADLEGQIPFTWTIKELKLHLSENSELKLSNIKFRFAIFPLFKGRLAINYLKIENADYSTYLAKGHPFSREDLEKISLPFPIRLNHFSIERLNLINREDGSSLTLGASGKAMVQQNMHDFALSLRLYSPDAHKTRLEAVIVGSKKKDSIAAKLGMNVPLRPGFLLSGIHADLVSEISMKGPWTTWQEVLYDLPVTKGAIVGEVKGMAANARIDSLPLLSRSWKFKTQFSLASGHDIHLQSFLLSSNLVRIKGKGTLCSDWEKSVISLAFSAPDLSLFFLPVGGSAKGNADFWEGKFRGSLETKDLALCTNNLKNREFDKEAPQNFCLERVTIAGRQGTSEDSNSEKKPTQSKIDSSGGLCIKKYAVGTLRLDAGGSVENHAWNADVKIAAIPFDASFALAYIPQTLLSIVDFTLNSSGAHVGGNLYYDISDRLYEGTLAAHVEDFSSFGKFFGEETLGGKVDAEVVLSTEDNVQNARCALIASNLRYQEILLDDLSMRADIEDLLSEPTGDFHFLAEKVFTPGFYLERMDFRTRSDELQWPFELNAEGRIESPFECHAKGFWQKDISLITIELTKLLGELADTPFSLKYPCEMQWGANYLNLSPFDFEIGKGNLFSAFELSPVRSLGQWELKHFPLEVLSCLRPRFALNGYISGSGFIDASNDNIEGSLNAVIEEAGVLHFGKKEPFRARGSLQAHLNHQMMQVHTALNATDAQFLDFNASLPIVYNLYPLNISLDKTKNTSAELLAEGKLQDLFDFVNLGTNHFTGLFSCRLFLSQTLSSPSLQGQIEWQNGTYENYFTGIDLRHINAQFEARNNEVRLTELTAGDDKSGEVTAEGKILLKPEEKFPYAFEAEMNQLHAVGFDMIDCDLTGPVYLTGDLQNMRAQGNLLIDSAKIQITERLPYEIPSMPVTFVNTPRYLISKTVSNGPNFQFHMDLELTSEGTVRVEGRGLNAELEGNVRLYGTNTNIAANGALKLIKGEYIFSGKVFKLTDGEVIFSDKPSPSAYLHLNGTLALPDIAITAMLRGPLMSPQLTFQSNPQKPTSSILALILFNKDISDISHPEAIQLASVLVSLSGGAGPDVLETIRKSIGIDRLNIGSSPGTDELALQIGKYLTRGIMITLSQSATSSQVIVEVELPKGFIFQAETQENEEGKFSLKWRKSY